MGLADTRMSVVDLLDLLGEPPIARRFGFDGRTHERLAELLGRARIRWGLNAAHRASFGLGEFSQGTWVDGLQRLLLGVALSGDDLAYVKATLPTDDVDSSDVTLLGGLAEFISRIGRLVENCGSAAPMTGWTARCRTLIESLCEFTYDDSWQAGDVLAGLARIDARWDPGCPPVGRTTAMAVIEDEFAGRVARRGFGDGSLVVCGLTQLLHVPHRVVCLLGWDEPAYPRALSRDGDDLMRDDPQPGDPSPAAADRQALLDAVNMATEHLVVVARGRSRLTNQKMPLSAPVRALVAALDATACTADGCGAGQAVTVEHPLQPFSPRCFDGSIPRSFDAAAFRTARASRRIAEDGPDPAALVLPPIDSGAPVALDDLVAFFRNPARTLLRVRMGLPSPAADASPDQLPIQLDPLQRWAVGDRLLRYALAGLPPERVIDAERRRGDIPPGALGARLVDDLSTQVAGVLTRFDRLPLPARGPAVTHEITWSVDDIYLAGQVDVHGQAIVTAEFSRSQPRQRLTSWVRLVALASAVPGDWRAYVVTPGATRALRAPSPSDARRILATLLGIYRYGLTRPIPAPPRVNEAWTSLRRMHRDPGEPGPSEDLKRAWSYDQDDSWLTFYPRDADEFLARGVDPGFEFGPSDEHTMQGRLARAIWDDILDNEVTP